MVLTINADEVATGEEWTLVQPHADATQLAELSAFRGRILYANGRRPDFKRQDGSYSDEDPLDSDSFHITVRALGGLVGCVRLRPLPEHAQTLLAPILSAELLDSVLLDLGVVRDDCVEARGLAVEPLMRGTGLAIDVLLGCWVLGRCLAKRLMFGAVGTRDGQSKLLAHIGAQLIPHTDTVFVSEFDDDLQAMYIDLDHPSATLQADLKRVACLLGLPELKS